MTKDELVTRINEIQSNIESTLSQYNALIGRREEAKYMLETIVKKEAELAKEGTSNEKA